MPWKLILFIAVIVLVAIFVGVNHANVCNISFIFAELHNVPVYLTILFSFVIGILIMIPFTIGKKRGKAAPRKQGGDLPVLASKEEYPAESARNRRNRKRQEAAARKAEKKEKKESSSAGGPAAEKASSQDVLPSASAEGKKASAEAPSTVVVDNTSKPGAEVPEADK